MFGFANALLLALFAAAGVDLVLALRRKAVGQLFTVPHYLFGDWGGEARARWGQRAFLLALMLYEFTVVFCNSMARENWPFLQGQLAPVLDMIMYTLLCGKILLGTRYTWRELLAGGALYFIARWVYFNSQNIWWIGIVVARKLCQNGICLVYKRNFWRFLTNIKTDAMPFVRLSDYDRIIRSGAVRHRPASTV